MICDSGANADVGGEVLEISCSTSMRRKSGLFKNAHKEKSVKKIKGKRKCAK